MHENRNSISDLLTWSKESPSLYKQTENKRKIEQKIWIFFSLKINLYIKKSLYSFSEGMQIRVIY